MAFSTIFILLICGICTNMVSAIFGIGGGVLMVPILRTLFPALPIQVISATSLTIVMCTALINLLFFHKQKIKIDYINMILWSIAMVIGMQIGFELSFYFSTAIISLIFTVSLSALAIKTFLNRSRIQIEVFNMSPIERAKGSISFCGGGLIAGITGIGGGSILAPLVGQLKGVKTQQIAVYTNYMMIIGGIGNLYGYLTRAFPYDISLSGQLGYVNFLVVGVVTLGSFGMSFFSMKLRGLMNPVLTRKLLAIILFCIAAYMCILEFVFH
ncbi:TPA: sulfite exporter TauE/SafE family protein [Haemophilus influenzae]|uniref:sulfite exporter TauE/SafE family protein n=1 Tax=Haemophilus influenzae TaxID=727 RepID=UPI000CFFEB1B|nr:sulfite exporter TauE/SafE family protein [Haemophilus influenzae]MCK9007572.1 sulfite exporter TauE/SafE family protein [Haemophilus influenzae]MCK9653637.1 sulfite exporter TauE/SafE family protein [Haemophilus influenzae]PRI34178.1 Sulfite exporter TauE/SafE [Haemophilus influenzae]PRI38675.1 Sulfite exporter TauE/SafE [Haemophilus influenzae]PRM52489.1 Sulfite exporter TauE/SafE [Haemophilus influenzae]